MKADHLLILTLDELPAYLKIGKRTLYGLAAKEEIPAFKVGGEDGDFGEARLISGLPIKRKPARRRR